MKRRAAARERGLALLALLAAVALASTWMLVSRLHAESGALEAARRQRNAEVLARAKQALVAYVAAQASKAGKDRPGALPCPEAPGYFDNPGQEGQAAGACTLPAVGRFPWRTLGLDKLVDASGEPLWYAVAAGWAGANTVINSNCASPTSGMACASGRLTVDGLTDDVIALLIAPGPAIRVSASPGCSAWVQTRPATAPPDLRNWLECENATLPPDPTFVTSGPAGSFNDQLVRITTADLLPALEAAIAHRIEREIVPALRDVYVAPNWGLAGGDRVYPYAAPFANPSTSTFTGLAGTTQGLLPLSFMESHPGSGVACNPATDGPRCNPTLVRWTDSAPSISHSGGGSLAPLGCGYSGPTLQGWCWGTYTGHPATLRLSGRQSNGAMSLRQLNSAAVGSATFIDLTTFQSSSASVPPSVGLEADGTFTVSVTVTPPAPAGAAGVFYFLQVPGNATSDHSLLDARASGCLPNPPGCPATSWFVRNRWHELVYYAVAPGYTAAAPSPRGCTTGKTCLTVANVGPAGAQRAILILAGRSINGASRPSATLADYLEFGNASGAFERQPVSTWRDPALKKPFNDRIVVIESNH